MPRPVRTLSYIQISPPSLRAIWHTARASWALMLIPGVSKDTIVQVLDNFDERELQSRITCDTILTNVR